MEACELLTLEARLDRIEAELAAELPPHLRAFARAHARGAPTPPAPDVLQRPATLATARAALVHPVLADRGLALLRLATPVVIEADPAVAAARSAAPTWAGLSALAAARDAAAMARFGRPAIDVLHRLHGSAIDLASLRAESSPAADPGPAVVREVNRGSAVVREADRGSAVREADRGPAVMRAADPGSAVIYAADPGLIRKAGPAVGVELADAASAARTETEPSGGDEASLEPPALGAWRTAPGTGEHRGAVHDEGVPGARAELRPGDGARAAPAAGTLPPPVPGWFDPDGVAVDERAIARSWDELRARHGIAGALQLERTAGAHPRAFVIAPGREVVLAIPAQVAAPAERFAVLHELGHAVAALALPAGLPRVVDESAAAYVARSLERDAESWYSPLAGAARARRCRLAQILDRIERTLPATPPGPLISERPPWALWHDPGAQAAYVAAEWLADAIEQTIGASPVPGALAAALSAWAASIDRLCTATYAI